MTRAARPTVVLEATPPGQGGLAILEVVGPDAIRTVAARFSKALPKPGLLAVGRLADDVVLRVRRGKESPYGEPMVEISCHGGAGAVAAVTEALGLPKADRASMIERAVANGRLDRIQAEAALLLPSAATLAAARMLSAQRDGALSRAVKRTLKGLLATAPSGLALARPSRVAIVGRANAGKSTLFNALVEADRALVSATPGTTRDPVEEVIAIAQVPYRLIDTAGLLPGTERIGLVDQLSIERTREEIGRADLILLVRDATATDTVDERLFRARVEGRRVLEVWNKIDLTQGFGRERIGVSARTGAGLERLRRALPRALGIARVRPGAPVVFTERQRTLLEAFEAGAREREVRRRLLQG